MVLLRVKIATGLRKLTKNGRDSVGLDVEYLAHTPIVSWEKSYFRL